MIDLCDLPIANLSHMLSSEYKRLTETDLPFLVDSLVVDGKSLHLIFKHEDLK
jgi:hypothetical protein